MSGERTIDAPLEPLLKARDVADLLGVSPDSVLDWWQAGKLPGFRLGGGGRGPVRFRASEVAAALEGWRQGPPAPRPVRTLERVR